LDQHRSTQRYERQQPQKDRELIEAIDRQVKRRKHRKYGYRRITEVLRRLGWLINHKRVYRLWSTHDFKLHLKRKGKKRYNGNGSNACDKKPPEYINHIWSYDFVEDKLDNGRKVRILNILDEFTRECLASESGFTMKGHDVTDVLRYLFLVRGCPTYIRSDNGPEFIAESVKTFLERSGVETLYIEPGSPWENGYIESFNARMRDELLNGELFLNLAEFKYVVDRWRMDYNHYRPHGSLSYQTPAVYGEQCRQKGLTQPQLPMPEQEKMAEILS
jgi:transposase InsO family protein